MNDGSWVKVDEGKFANLSAIAFIEESDDATTLYAGGAGPPVAPVRVTDTNVRRAIHSFVDQHATKAATAAAGASRY